MLKSKQKLCSIILAVVLLFSTTPAAFAANKSASHNLSNGALTLTAKDGDIRVYGSYDGYGAGIIVKQGYNGTITLDNVTINAKRDQREIDRRIADHNLKKQNNPDHRLDIGSLSSAIYIDWFTQAAINIVGENKINAEHTGINCSLDSDLLLIGDGTLDIKASSGGMSGHNGQFIIDAKTTVSGGIDTKELIINKETTVSGIDTGIEVKGLTINAKTTVHATKGTAIYVSGRAEINAETYAEGINGIAVFTDNPGGTDSSTIIIKADTTAIGTNGYGVYSPTNITVDNCTLTATGSKKGVQIGQGQKNVIKGNGKIDAKSTKR